MTQPSPLSILSDFEILKGLSLVAKAIKKEEIPWKTLSEEEQRLSFLALQILIEEMTVRYIRFMPEENRKKFVKEITEDLADILRGKGL